LILNLSSWLPFVFTYNPEEVDTSKKINYVVAPNIGGAFKEKFFSGFDSKEISFSLICIDMEDPLGVTEEIAYFDQLSSPDPGLIGIATSFFGNENYPPPQILLQFGASLVPVVWDVMDISIKKTHFRAGMASGIFGIPKRCEVSLRLSLVEDHVLNRANQIAEKALYITGSVESVIKEVIHVTTGKKKDQPGIFPAFKDSRIW
jgi:hypothetical protein